MNSPEKQTSQANQYAEIICSELNVKELVISLGFDEQNRAIELVYRHDTIKDRMAEPLDLVIGHMPQHKPDLAALLYIKQLEANR